MKELWARVSKKATEVWRRLVNYLRGNPYIAKAAGYKRYIICAALVFLLCFAIARSSPQQVAPAVAPVTPAAQSPVEFDADTYSQDGTIYVTGAPGMTTAEISAAVTITPDTPFRIIRLSGDRFGIRVTDPDGQKYTVRFTDPAGGGSWTTTVDTTPLTVELSGLNTTNYPVDEPIRLSFNKPVDPDELRRYLHIEPGFGYTLSPQPGNSIWIEPEQNLPYDTHFQIYIDSDLRAADGMARLAGSSYLEIATQGKDFKVALVNTSGSTLQAGNPYQMQFSAAVSANADVPLIVELFRFPTMEKYLNQAELLANYDIDPSPLEREDVFVHKLSDEKNTVELRSPAVGGYLLRATAKHPLTGETYEFREAFAVSDFSIYAQTSGNETLVWANSSATGRALAGYTVEFRKSAEETLTSAVTDGDGVAVLRYRDPDGGYYSQRLYGADRSILVVKNPAGDIVYADQTGVLYRGYRTTQEDRYYSFLQTDRPVYKPTDEIQFWGFLRPYAYNTNPMPRQVRVMLGEGSLSQSVDVTVGQNGSFQGVIPLEMIKSSNYRLALQIVSPHQPEPASQAETEGVSGGEDEPEEPKEPEEQPLVYDDIEIQYVQVLDYKKPTFVINCTTDKAYYAGDDVVTLTIKPTFYDGTPMPNYPLEVKVRESYYEPYTLSLNVTTDADGVATASFPANMMTKESTGYGWLPAANRYAVIIAEDGENIVYRGEYTFLPSDTLVYSKMERQEDGNLTLTVDTASLSLATVAERPELQDSNRYVSYWNSYEYTKTQFDLFRGAPKDTRVRARVGCSYYNLKGEWTSAERELELETKNGTATVTNLIQDKFDTEKYMSVWVYLYTEDSRGMTVRSNCYFHYGSSYRKTTEKEKVSPGYNFLLYNQNGENVLGPYESYLSYNRATLADGDTMNFELMYQDRPANNNGRILYTIIQEEIVQRGFTTGNTLQLTQTVQNADTFNLVAAYFDGKNVYPIRNTIVSLDKASLALNVEVTPDKASYQPGEQVRLQVRVTDEAGRGVAGTTCLSIVDEAVFAVLEQSINVLEDLYADFYFDHYYILKYATGHGDFVREYGTDGGKGAGPGMMFVDTLRKNFKDTAIFDLIRTDANGNGSLTFTLPDNVTSWRVTGVSIGDNLYAGQSKTNFVSTMPFFMQPVISQKYIAGDDIAMLVQGHGVALDADSQIHYTVRVTGDGVDETKETDELAYNAVLLNFGKLAEGEYTVSATAQFANYRDTVELPLAIVSSNLELVVNKQVDLSKPLDINAMRYPVTMTFYDKAHEAYYSSISSLLKHYCMQSGQRMSRFVAKRALAKHMEINNIPQYISDGKNDSAGDMQNYDGGIGYYLGGESDPFVTAKVLIVAKDQYDLETMAEYFHRIIEKNNGPEEIANAYLGLAVIGEDVSAKIHEMLAKPLIPLYQRFYLIAALGYLGETEEAAQLYEQQITPQMKDQGNGRYYSATNAADNDKLTAAAWIAACVLGHDDADGISIYFAQKSWRISTLFEAMIYVTHYDKEVVPSVVTYQVGGRTVTLNLGLKGSSSVAFNKSEFESLSFENTPENISAKAYFIGEPTEVDIQPTDQFSVKKDITPVANGRYNVKLTLTFEDGAPNGYYDISDWVPSNMRLYTVDKTNYLDGREWWYSHSTEGQKIYFKVYRYTGARSAVIEYTMQKTFDAEAVVDSTYVIHGDTGMNAHTTRTVIR